MKIIDCLIERIKSYAFFAARRKAFAAAVSASTN
jgi:hypothetical protein